MDKNKIPQSLDLKRVPGGHSFFYSKLLDYQSELQKNRTEEDVDFGEVVEKLGLQSHEIFLLFLSLLFLQPIPLPGLSTFLGILMMLVAPYEFLNKPPRIPRFFQSKKIKVKTLFKIAFALQKIWEKLEKYSKSRFLFLIHLQIFRVINFSMTMISAFLLALPLPIPFTNSLPSWTIFLNQLGQIEDDGLIVFISYLVFGMTIFYFSLLGFSIQQVWVFLN